MSTPLDVVTPSGTARVSLTGSGPRLLALGHGAGGSSWSADLLAVRERAVAAGWTVALVDQPWRVAGRKVAARPPVLDAAWVPVLARLRSELGPELVVVGGRSAGARVACRTASEVAADAVLCLSFPLHPPGRPGASRVEELRVPIAAGLPVRVVQGVRDPFGSPDEVRAELTDPAVVVETAGTHSLTAPATVGELVAQWLGGLA